MVETTRNLQTDKKSEHSFLYSKLKSYIESL